MGPASLLFSLQSKLILAFVVVTLAALALAGSVFVFLQRGEQEEQALDHIIATSPAIYTEFSFLQRRGDPEAVLASFVAAAAEENSVRILLVDRVAGTVALDSAGDLSGEQLALTREVVGSLERPVPGQPYISWRPHRDSPGSGLIMVSALPSRLSDVAPRGSEPFWLVLAVPKDTITEAWQDLLPAIGLAAAIAVPAAAVLAIGVASYITHPLQRLTVASREMAEGRFDVEVSVDRRDEVGRLSQAFSTMARRIGDAQSQMHALVANVSHDLKTPVTSILGFAQALRDGRAVDDADARRMGAVIHDEATRLTARLNDLLYLSEIESGQAVVEREEVDLRRLIASAVERIEPDTNARGVTIDVDVAEGVVVSADGAKLERAIENLLDNARKYTPAAGEIRVRAYREEGGPRPVRIELANTADVAPEELPRLFERFYRRDRTRGADGEAGGSGLGLPIARDLIELHGGELDASASDGQLAFMIRLPRRP